LVGRQVTAAREILDRLEQAAAIGIGVIADADGKVCAELGEVSDHVRALAIVEASRARATPLRRIAPRPPGFVDVLALRLPDCTPAQVALVARRTGRAFNATERATLLETVAVRALAPVAELPDLAAVRRRSPIRAYVTDLQLSVLSSTMPDPFAEWRTDETTAAADGGLPRVIEAAVHEAIDGWDVDAAGPHEQIIFPFPSLVVRIVPLARDGAVGLALFLERLRGSLDLDAAARRYRISARELSVARLLIEGASLEEVGTRLEIAAPTVAAHVRNLIVKTGARRRAEMIARLLGW
jgi:DNA-binding CsgD family transcriptional regulator